jgi:hypothetical protein
MTVTVDTAAGVIVSRTESGESRVPLYSKEGFELLSRLWLKVGWNQKYTYTFSWFGRPVIQLPDDMIRLQEVIHRVAPDVIVETGVAHGGSLIYYASLCKALDRGRVIGVDIEIRPHNKAALDAHPLRPFIELVEGSSIDAAIVGRVRSQIRSGDTVLVLLDSNHCAITCVPSSKPTHRSSLPAPTSWRPMASCRRSSMRRAARRRGDPTTRSRPCTTSCARIPSSYSSSRRGRSTKASSIRT